jgi:phosphoribosyl-ATP pyrophosphohydrolase/phosphoribosyl-AMP cyclohydrolase
MKKAQATGSTGRKVGREGIQKLLATIKFDPSGLIPAIIQDAVSGDILMMAYMNRKSLEKTLTTGLTHFWSRSRKQLWQKGESSGNIQRVRSIYLDCDQDTLLIQVEQTHVACHTGRWSCFHQQLTDDGWMLTEEGAKEKKAQIFDKVYQTILDRKAHPKENSYVTSLMKMGKDRILRKIGEESGELIIGSKNNQKPEIISEMADLWFHTLVLLGYHGITPQEIYQELEKRHGKSGLRKKSD